MKQLRFEFLREKVIELPVDLEPEIQEELAAIPKGVEHCPKSIEQSYILLFEPYVLKTQGD